MVFARAPRLGAVKRRLARDIGDRAALRFHVGTMTRLLRALAADRRFRTVLAVTPDHAPFRLPVRVARIPQGGGDLGVRMDRALPAVPAWPRGDHRLRHPRRRAGRCARGVPRAGQRARGVRSGGGRRLLAGGDVTAPSGASVRCGALVHRARAGGHAGQFRRPAGRAAAHAARCGYRRGLGITPGNAGDNRAAPPPACGESCGASSPPTRSRSAARRP